jgi:hypothetical protein
MVLVRRVVVAVVSSLWRLIRSLLSRIAIGFGVVLPRVARDAQLLLNRGKFWAVFGVVSKAADLASRRLGHRDCG